MKKTRRIVAMLLIMLSVTALAMAQDAKGKKILFIDSYHAGYAWSDGVTNGIETALAGSGAELKIFRMDTKRNKGEAFAKESALKAKALIEQFKPDVVIAADDNAAKYLLAPYYKESTLPFVFCGLNWDASIYGFPTKNITGMLEVSPIPQLLAQLQPYSKGTRVGHLAADAPSARKEGEYYKKIFNMDLVEYYATDFADWQKGFNEFQGKVDMLIVGNNAGIMDWNEAEAKNFVRDNTKIATGATQEFIADYALITFAKIAEEQGNWSAMTALEILKGKSPADIPIVQNKEGALIINTRIASKLGMEIPFELIQSATKVIE